MTEYVETQQLVAWVNEQRLPLREVMARSGLTRQGIWKRLNRAGVYIPRRAKEGAPGVMVEVSCAWCARVLIRRKRMVETRKILRSFCNTDCRNAALQSFRYVAWRQGQRIARGLVAQHFPLEEKQVVHHKDGDNRNNTLANLAVYASNAEHTRLHRGRTVRPLWDGAEERGHAV